ncbi:hypothetical protein OUZ56_012541 [Daphnia magna]|uniref:SWIM-type domain-containing protein n=1 Tax=Daphnia magna TaxID=35525 RepID=A0ABQ9Z3B6_9CRUS|nr:hypothetical protein OUZ56_012541 [Daphnia magna]
MGASNVSNLIPQTINLFKLSDYANGLVQIEKDIYLEKLLKVNIDCPYLFPDQMWQTSIKLLETFLSKIDRHTLYIYLIARRNKDTLLQLNAQKTMNEAENYVKSGWVSSLAAINMESGNVIVRAAVHHSQAIKKKQVLPWVAIDSKTNIIIEASCQCTGGLSGVCCHVGAVCYSVIYANSLPSTSKENVWLDTHPKRSVELIKQFSNLNSSQHEHSVEEIRKSRKRKIVLTSDIPGMSENEIKKFHEELIEHKSVQLIVLNNFSNHFTPPDLPKPLSELYNPSFLKKTIRRSTTSMV